MAVLRDTDVDNSIQNYVATVGLFCVISCTVLMLRLRGFKASLNILGESKNSEIHNDASTVSLTGAYKINTGEFFDSGGSVSDPPKKILPSMVKLPPHQSSSNDRPSKSTSDLTQISNQPSILKPSTKSKLPPPLQKSTPEISRDPQGTNNNNSAAAAAPADAIKLNKKDAQKQEKEQKLLEKKRLEEQKKRDKLAAQEKAKLEKIKKEKQKQEAIKRAKEAKRIEKENKAKKEKDKGKGKTSTPTPSANPLAQGARANPRAQGPSGVQGPSTQTPQYSTNTLESSISKTSGPPPYSAIKTAQAKPEVVLNKSDNTGNTSFSKPDEGGSWDMISQHRQQINRQIVASAGRPKQTVMDLQFNESSGDGQRNTEV